MDAELLEATVGACARRACSTATPGARRTQAFVQVHALADTTAQPEQSTLALEHWQIEVFVNYRPEDNLSPSEGPPDYRRLLTHLKGSFEQDPTLHTGLWLKTIVTLAELERLRRSQPAGLPCGLRLVLGATILECPRPARRNPPPVRPRRLVGE